MGRKANKLVLFATIAMFATCCYMFYINCRSVLAESFDTGWIIQTGRYIIASGWPQHDIFSWVLPARPIVIYQWLFEVGAAALYGVGGLWLFGLVCCAITGFIYFYLLPWNWMKRGIPMVIPFAFLSLVLGPHWFNARPQLLSYLFLFTTVCLMERYRTNRATKLVWLLCPLYLVWANVHAFWTFGILLVAVYAIADAWRNSRWTAACTLFVACALCTLVNPYGAHLLPYILSFADGSQFMGMRETQSALNCPDCLPPLVALLAGCGLVLRRRKELPLEASIICVFALVLAVCIRRFESIAVIMSWQYIGLSLQLEDLSIFRASEAFRRLVQRQAVVVPVALIATCIAFVAQFPSSDKAQSTFFEGGMDTVKFVVEKLGKDDDLFNDAIAGSWLILEGSRTVFIDTRYDSYPKSFNWDVRNVIFAASGWQNFLEQHGVKFILLRNEYSALQKALYDSGGWLPVIDDGTLTFWAKETPANQSRLETWGVSDDLLLAHDGNKVLLAPVAKRTIHARSMKYFDEANRRYHEAKYAEASNLFKRCLRYYPDSDTLKNALTRAEKQELSR